MPSPAWQGAAVSVAAGATLMSADRRVPGAYDGVRHRDWDAVAEVSWHRAWSATR